MKKLIALLLIMIMLFGEYVFAEDLAIIRQIPEYEFATSVLTQESYPEVRLISEPFHHFLTPEQGLQFLCFHGPDGGQVRCFQYNEARFSDVENKTQYAYRLEEVGSFGQFLESAASADLILKDGSDGVAAIINPDQNAAGAMIAVVAFGKFAKLSIGIELDNPSINDSGKSRTELLTNAILAEVERVRADMCIETYSPWWSANQFAGIEMLSDDYSKLMRIEFPALETLDKHGAIKQLSLFVTDVDGQKCNGIYDLGDGVSVQIEFGFDISSVPFSQKEQDALSVQRITLDNGSRWLFYPRMVNDDGSFFSWYASKQVEDMADSKGNPYYINVIYASFNDVIWKNVEDCKKTLNMIDTCLTIVDSGVEPYAASGGFTQALMDFVGFLATEASDTETGDVEGWICPNCGMENIDNYCTECGTARVEESAEWICSVCGQSNENNFCTRCGTARP